MWRCGETRCCAYFGPKSGDGKLAEQHGQGRQKFEKEFTLEVFEKRMTWNTLSIRCSLKWGLRETDIGRYIQYDI